MNVIETWINSTLREAEYFNLNGTIMLNRGNVKKEVALQDYQIDRMTLNNAGISNS